jgi:hypothetical protein
VSGAPSILRILRNGWESSKQMKGEDSIAIYHAEEPDEELQANLTPELIESIRLNVLEGIAEIETATTCPMESISHLRQASPEMALSKNFQKTYIANENCRRRQIQAYRP